MPAVDSREQPRVSRLGHNENWDSLSRDAVHATLIYLGHFLTKSLKVISFLNVFGNPEEVVLKIRTGKDSCAILLKFTSMRNTG
jgi:hypothetical protein